MRELARIQFRGDKADYVEAWNSRSDHKIEYGVIAVYRDDPAYHELRQLFREKELDHPMTWYERVYPRYSNKELATVEVFWLDILGRGGEGNNSLAEVYATELACPACGRLEYSQKRDLILDLAMRNPDRCETAFFRDDICKTDFHEVIVSQKLKELLEVHGTAGLSFRSVESIARPRPGRRIYSQIVVEPTIGPAIEPSRVRRQGLCAKCGKYRSVLLPLPGTLEAELYFSRSSYSGESIMRTVDEFGSGPRYGQLLIVNQALYRVLRANRVSGFVVHPAHLV
jgi:hypothetical protein